MKNDISVIKGGVNKLLTFVRTEQADVHNSKVANTCTAIDLVSQHVMCALWWRFLKLYKLKKRLCKQKIEENFEVSFELFVTEEKTV